MVRLNVPTRLLREPEAKGDEERFDHLCRVAASSVRRILPDVMARLTAETGVDLLSTEVQSLLELLLEDPSTKPDLEKDSLIRKLSNELRKDLVKEVDVAFLEDQTRTIAGVMMSSWVDLLRRALDTYPILLLDNDLLPARIVDTSVQEWREAVNALGLSAREATLVMSGIREQSKLEKAFELPLSMQLHVLRTQHDSPLTIVTAKELENLWATDLDMSLLARVADLSRFHVLPGSMLPGYALGVQGIIGKAGYVVYPSEVEKVLKEHPAVVDAAIFGVPTASPTEESIAAVVEVSGATYTSAEELLGFCQICLNEFQRPSTIYFASALPRDNEGKLDIAHIIREFSRGRSTSRKT
jgi:hypothetical protein